MSDDSVGEALDKLGGFGNFAVSKGLVTVTEKKRIEYATLNLIKQLDGEDFPSFVAAIAESTSCDFPIAVCLKGILVRLAKTIVDDAWRSTILALKCAFCGVTLREADLVSDVQLEDTGIVTCEEKAACAQMEIASKHRCLFVLTTEQVKSTTKALVMWTKLRGIYVCHVNRWHEEALCALLDGMARL